MAKAKGGSASTGAMVFGGLIVLGLVITYWYVIVAVAVLVGLAFLASHLWEERAKRRAVEWGERAALSARADRQHQQCLDGDQRGVYGLYLPAALGRMTAEDQT